MTDKRENLLITGANGYLASNILKSIQDMNLSISAVTSKRSLMGNYSIPSINMLQSDMSEFKYLHTKLIGKIDVAVNFAWIGARGGGQDEEDIQKKNEEYSLDLLRSLIEAGCETFIQIGSMAEYGIQKDVITEKTKCKPVTAYAKHKYSCANRMRDICEAKGIRFFEFRMGSMYGNYMPENNIIGYLCRQFSKNKHVSLQTQCNQEWEYTHVDDFAEIFCSLLTRDIPGGIYNISNGDCHPLKYFLNILEKKYSLQEYIEYGIQEQGIGCQNIHCDIRKVKKTFGKEKFLLFSNGIDSTIQSIKVGM